MNLTTQKRIAAEILKCGIHRVRLKETKDVGEALTREDIRGLIKEKLIWKVQIKGTSRVKARHLLKQKKRGRRRGPGSKKGQPGVGKTLWVARVRAQRQLLRDLRESKRLQADSYQTIYLRVKGGMFRSKKHLQSYLKEHELIIRRKK